MKSKRPPWTCAWSKYASAANHRLGWIIVAVALAVAVLAGIETRSAEAAFPGLNGRIAFDTERNGLDGDIYAIGSDGTGLSALTDRFSHEYDPSFSSDGRKVAFTSNRNGNWDIYVINAGAPESARNPAVRVTTGAAEEVHPTFSPDGTKIAFERYIGDTGGSNIYAKNADGSGPATLIADVATWDSQPDWSPDGRKLAFSAGNENNRSDFGIYSANAAGSGEPTRVTGTSERAFQPSWSPDGLQIAYGRWVVRSGFTVPSESGVYRIRYDGSSPPVAVANGRLVQGRWAYGDTPAWSPNGRQIAYVSVEAPGPGATVLSTRIYRVSSGGSGIPAFVTEVNPHVDDPHLDWQPLPAFRLDNRAISIPFRDIVLISGRFVYGGQPVVSGQRLSLWEQPAGSLKDFSPVPGAETITDEDGSFAFDKVQPRANTNYQVRFAGDEEAGLKPAMSSIKPVDVRVLISLNVSTQALTLGKSLTMSGKVSPAHQGDEVILTIERNGERVGRKSVALNEDSRYSLAYEPSRTGEYSVIARFPGDANYAGSASPIQTFSVGG